MIREPRGGGTAPAEEILYLRSPAAATRLALSFKSIAADVYWIRVVQYYGSTRLSHSQVKTYNLLFPLLDLTTSLDPQFNVAYRFGAFFLSEPPPGGPGRMDLAKKLLDKAIAANPTRWEYPYDVGFLYYRSEDYPRAAEWFRRAADVTGSPEWLRPLVAVTLATGGQTSAARMLWTQMRAMAEEEWLRSVADFRLRQLDTLDAIRSLDDAVAAFARTHGGRPADWTELVRDGLLRGVPVDAAGYPLVLTPDGAIGVSRESPMWPLPTEKR
jgi:tetratricopeptide (TPR) repeat protein